MTGEAIACFGCGARDQLQEVGDTVFCGACLGRMLRRVDERTAGPTAGHGRGRPEDAGDRSAAGRARLARTATVDAVQDPIAELIIRGELSAGGSVVVDVERGALQIRPVPPPERPA